MTDQSNLHETIAWAKQRLDDVDVIIHEVEKTSGKGKENAEKEAEVILARLKSSHVSLQKYYDSLRTKADDVKQTAEDIRDSIEIELVEIESAFQSYLSVIDDQLEAQRAIVVARAQAQRRSWETSLKELRDRATEAVENARVEFDAALKQLSNEADKFQAGIGGATTAGGESWTAVKAGLIEARAVHDRTIQKIKDTFSKLL